VSDESERPRKSWVEIESRLGRNEGTYAVRSNAVDGRWNDCGPGRAVESGVGQELSKRRGV
jgi:hypothetical protein